MIIPGRIFFSAFCHGVFNGAQTMPALCHAGSRKKKHVWRSKEKEGEEVAGDELFGVGTGVTVDESHRRVDKTRSPAAFLDLGIA